MKIFLFLLFPLFFLFCFSSNDSFSQQMSSKWIKKDCLPIEQEQDNRIYLKVHYKEDTFKMMLDSYSWFSSFPERWVVNKWKLKSTPYQYATRDINNKRKKVRLRLMDTITIEDRFSASNFYINPKKTLDTYQVGVLGNDFLNDYNWQINFANGVVCYDSMPYPAERIEIKNEFSLSNFPSLPLKIGDIEHQLIVDLGAANEIIIPEESRLGTYLIQTYNLQSQKKLVGGANSEMLADERYEVVLDSISLGKGTIKNVKILISRNTKVSLIGCGVLKRGILYLNYRNGNNNLGQVAFEIKE